MEKQIPGINTDFAQFTELGETEKKVVEEWKQKSNEADTNVVLPVIGDSKVSGSNENAGSAEYEHYSTWKEPVPNEFCPRVTLSEPITPGTAEAIQFLQQGQTTEPGLTAPVTSVQIDSETSQVKDPVEMTSSHLVNSKRQRSVDTVSDQENIQHNNVHNIQQWQSSNEDISEFGETVLKKPAWRDENLDNVVVHHNPEEDKALVTQVQEKSIIEVHIA